MHDARRRLVLVNSLRVTSLLCLLVFVLAACGVSTQTTTGANGAVKATSTATNSNGAPYRLPAHWTNVSGLPELHSAFPASYAFAPSNSHMGYACSPQAHVLYTTHDSGSSWQVTSTKAFSACSGVFVDARDANDVFVESLTPPSGSATERCDLWRSRDRGATWSHLGAIPSTGLSLSWAQVAVVGSQLIGQAQIDQEGSLQNDLYVSNDGGMSWRHFAQSIANQGYTITAFTLIGSAIVLTTDHSVGTAGLSVPLHPTTSYSHSSAVSTLALDAPLSGQPPSPPVYWRSLDAGATWSQMKIPGTGLIATPDASGTRGYALAVSTRDVSASGQPPIYDVTLSWSADSGATWRTLPDLLGFGNGYVIGSGAQLALAPNGAVFISAQHAPQSYGDDAGVFYLQPSASAPAWHPLVAGGTQVWQAITTPTGTRLLSIGSFQTDTHLKYVDVAGL